MGGNNCTCLWGCSSNKEQRLINFKYFWSKVCYDECGSQIPRKLFSERIRRLYLPKDLIFTTKDHNYILTIGIDPDKKFEVLLRLEYEGTGAYIELSISEMKELFKILNQTFQVNLNHPSTLSETTTAHTENLDLCLKSLGYNAYILSVRGRKLFIKSECLLKLKENESCIKLLMKSYDIKSVLCGNSVFKLLNICAQQLRNPVKSKRYFASDDNDEAIVLEQNNMNLAEKINLSEILDELMCSPCDCTSTTFIIETKLHFHNLISRWIGVYYETRLLSEDLRMDTFKNGKWPHKFIDIRTLAKHGFYYVGPFDQVQCIFCKIMLKKWQPEDTVEREHKRFAPFCCSSLHKAADNI